jgi:hypothetical protein
MSKPPERAPAKPAAAEAKEDPHAKSFIAEARRIADQRAQETAEALKGQAHVEAVQRKMAEGAAKTRAEAEQ